MHIFLDKMSLIAADTPSISPPLPPFPLTLPPDFLLLFVEKKCEKKICARNYDYKYPKDMFGVGGGSGGDGGE